MSLQVVILSENDVPGASFNGKDVESHTNMQLKRWLTCRGLKRSGNRSSLIQRCKDCMSSSKRDQIDITVDGGKWYEKKAAELNKDLQSTHSILPIVGWKDFTRNYLPPLYNYGHVYHWLVESMPTLPAGDGESDDEDNNAVITEKSLRRGQQYLKSGCVSELKVKLNAKMMHYKGLVEASMRATNYNVTASLSSVSGAVLDASCHCKASSLSRCSHIAAVLLYLTNVNSEKLPACTDLPCQWKKGKKRKTPKSINECGERYTSYKSPCRNTIMFDPRPSGSNVSDHAVNCFLRELCTSNQNTNVTSMWETVLVYSYSDYPIHDELKTLIVKHRQIYKTNLTPSDNSIHSSSSMISGTLEQSATDTWQCNRYLRMTASTAKNATLLWRSIVEWGETGCVKTKLYQFLRKKMWGLDQVLTSYMIDGLKNEDKAREDYALFKQNNNANFTARKTGLWVSHQYPQLACSPDGVAFDPLAENQHGIIEIKVLKVLQKYSPQELVENIHNGKLATKDVKGACFKMVDGKLVLKKSHAYYYQVQYQLGVTGCKWCDFILWSCKGQPSVQRIYSDSDFIKDIMEANLKLWNAVVVPELVEMRVVRGLSPFIMLYT